MTMEKFSVVVVGRLPVEKVVDPQGFRNAVYQALAREAVAPEVDADKILLANYQ
jgi:hypothetical protein